MNGFAETLAKTLAKTLARTLAKKLVGRGRVARYNKDRVYKYRSIYSLFM